MNDSRKSELLVLLAETRQTSKRQQLLKRIWKLDQESSEQRKVNTQQGSGRLDDRLAASA